MVQKSPRVDDKNQITEDDGDKKSDEHKKL